MRRIDLLKSTPFRLAVIFAALFIASFLVAGVVTYQLLKHELADRLDQTIQDTYTVLTASYGDGDVTDLSDTVTSHVQSTSRHDRIFLLRSKDGARLAGNIENADVSPGWSTIDSTKLGLQSNERYRVFSGQVDKQPLIVGITFEENDEYLRIVFISFAWASVMVLALATIGGILLATRVQRRMETITSTMRDVGSGKLNVRIPLVGNGDDIDRLSEQVNDALDRLASLVEGMRQVSTDIAHDLKTPLSRLSLTISQAIEKADKGTAVAADLLQAREESGNINATFDALLRIAQIEAGSRRSRFTQLDIRECLETIVDVYADVAEDKKQLIKLTLHPNESLPVTGDRELLIQLFANLTENSIRHCPAGAKISLSAKSIDRTIIVEFADNGPGIPAEERAKVFQRLYRLDKSRTTPGTGLGLSLVKAIVDLHRARINLEDGHPGLHVILTFPAGSHDKHAEPSAATDQPNRSLILNLPRENKPL
ncbi:HAMP domain-containing sensor histidine kinase [Phyllobacterium sp. OV277]|jgi:signal transduction histidine kinase|uniref:HAMP domain-containing sensor histidine kinase n=1 Tax=Phyllobacterium sp. OV277 TaxID=1882772 RepID=UPI0008891A47|nr:HAMP domain-containing sensor histidine kinase [Phyllobacterium sp. OV277]SDP70166.1 Signal transduction histidine kinase [Phyllobacterium sp. OV277]